MWLCLKKSCATHPAGLIIKSVSAYNIRARHWVAQGQPFWFFLHLSAKCMHAAMRGSTGAPLLPNVSPHRCEAPLLLSCPNPSLLQWGRGKIHLPFRILHATGQSHEDKPAHVWYSPHFCVIRHGQTRHGYMEVQYPSCPHWRSRQAVQLTNHHEWGKWMLVLKCLLCQQQELVDLKGLS